MGPDLTSQDEGRRVAGGCQIVREVHPGSGRGWRGRRGSRTAAWGLQEGPSYPSRPLCSSLNFRSSTSFLHHFGRVHCLFAFPDQRPPVPVLRAFPVLLWSSLMVNRSPWVLRVLTRAPVCEALSRGWRGPRVPAGCLQSDGALSCQLPQGCHRDRTRKRRCTCCPSPAAGAAHPAPQQPRRVPTAALGLRRPPFSQTPLLSWVFVEGDLPGLLSSPKCLRGKSAFHFWFACQIAQIQWF